MEKKDTEALGKRRRAVIYTVSVILVSFLLSLLLMFLANDAFSLTAQSGSTEVVFNEDVGLFKASGILKKAGLIDSRLWFTVYSQLRGKKFTVSAGRYEISNTGGFDGILSALQQNNCEAISL